MNWIKNKWIWAALGALVIVIVVAISRGGSDSPYEFATVEARDLLQEVTVTARVKPAKQLELGFERSGRVVSVRADVGDHVVAGQTIVVLDQSDLLAKRQQAEAKVSAEEARLAELARGTRPEEIEVERVKVANARQALAEEESGLVTEIREAYTIADDAIRNDIDQMFSNPRSDSPVFSVAGVGTLKSDVEWMRFLTESALKKWEETLATLSVSVDLTARADEAEADMLTIRDFLGKTALALSIAQPTANVTQTTLDSWKGAVSAARTSIDSALGSLRVADESRSSAKQALSLAEEQLTLALSGTVPEQIAIQQAAVAQARADVTVVNADLSKTVIRAPISGVITVQDAEVGEIISANKTVVTIISGSSFEIEANVPEADIALIEVGDTAKVSLDAYGDDTPFVARVAKIDPAETVIEGVSTYGVTLVFEGDDSRIKSGMTADVLIQTDSRTGVLAVPARAIMTENGDRFVRILSKKNGQETVISVPVETGLRASDGYIEILSGLSEGDMVITFER